MPPRIPHASIGLSGNSFVQSKYNLLRDKRSEQQICLLCSLSRNPRKRKPKQYQFSSRNLSADSITPEPSVATKAARSKLKSALIGLQKHAGSYVNVSRINLALRGLEQPAGQETVRIAILALADGGKSLRKVKQLVRAFIADPLDAQEQEWEGALMNGGSDRKPILFKIGKHDENEVIPKNALLQEFHVSSPILNSHNLEVLVLEVDPPLEEGSGRKQNFVDAALVPTMVTPTSNSGRYIPITLPVHKSLVVADGIMGATTLLSYGQDDANRDMILTAVNLPAAFSEHTAQLSSKFHVLDIARGDAGLQSFRQSVEKAMDYEANWHESGIAGVLAWVQDGTSSTLGDMKAPVRNLVTSLLADADRAIQSEHSRQVSAAVSAKITASTLQSLQTGLSNWSESSHRELRDDLDIAFNGYRWRKLGWWKLFWRVDDVSMISCDILNQRFLTNAEREIIFLSGRFQQAGVFKDFAAARTRKTWAYRPVTEELPSGPPSPEFSELLGTPADVASSVIIPKPWPLDIPSTRLFLSTSTVPALQALAQKLVFQTLSTSAFSSALAGLLYISSFSSTLYEAGAVAAIGIVWSLKRMQGKWETARTFWEGEVREEGRKAVRGTENALGTTLIPRETAFEGAAELETARKAVEEAAAALRACK